MTWTSPAGDTGGGSSSHQTAAKRTTIVTRAFDCAGCRRDERVGIDNGRIWVEAMTRTLERLDEGSAPGEDDRWIP